ncbi:MAG: nucleotidyltransferase family protein [Alphaproteobacteria bacterium]
MTPETAMVLAAGRGERLRPLTDARPKPLVEVAGKALIDHVLDRLAAAGVTRAVVNLWYMAGTIERHLADRRRPAIALSHESELLDTGGGVVNALGLLGDAPFYAVNSDVLWRDSGASALGRLAAVWDGGAMDALLLVVPVERAVGYEGRGDFERDPNGGLRRRGAAAHASYVFTGVQLLHPRLFRDAPAGPFSLNLVYDRALAAGRLRGLVHAGDWLHVGTLAGLAEAERRLGEAPGGSD